MKVAANLPEADLNPRIREAQTFDFAELVGANMYADMLENPETYAEIDFTPVLVYFSAARLVKNLDLHITPTGVMAKRNDYSERLDTRAIGYQATQYENLALAYWGEIAKQLNTAGKDVYPLWIGFNACGNISTGFRPRLMGIKGRGTNGYR